MGNYRNKKYNDYEIQEDYVIMYTQKGELFLVDLEDFYLVRKYCWWMDNRGYLRAKIGGQSIGLHQYLISCSKGEIVDHKITENKWDNRKANLRVGTQQKNCMNRKISSCNSSGVTGVSFDKSKNKWVARIGINYKKINLGAFDNKDDAIKARKEAEKKYFGEWSYDNSQDGGIENWHLIDNIVYMDWTPARSTSTKNETLNKKCTNSEMLKDVIESV